jgi:hypothetical protein
MRNSVDVVWSVKTSSSQTELVVQTDTVDLSRSFLSESLHNGAARVPDHVVALPSPISSSKSSSWSYRIPDCAGNTSR